MRNFRNYKIWNESVNFTTEIYKIINAFPSFEKFALADQLRRASVSIASNIAEGSARESEREFAHFLSISLGSAFEVETQLQIAHNLGYINQQLLDLLLKKIHPLERQINELITVYQKKKPTAKS